MSIGRKNETMEGTREFYAPSERRGRRNTGETQVFDRPREKNSPIRKKRPVFDKGISLASVNLSVTIILFALVVCLVVLLAVYYRSRG